MNTFRPLAVIREFWDEVIGIEETAELLEPVYIEAVAVPVSQ